MITAITTCMGRREHLETTLPLMLEEFDDVVVVDWSCPQSSGDWAAKQGAKVIRKKDQKFFNISKARNLGARQTQTRSVCFIDADTLPMHGVKGEIVRLLNLSTMVIASRTLEGIDITSLNGFLAVDIGQFWGVGGYDEQLGAGYGLEDGHLRAKLLLERGILPKRLTPGSLGALRHGNSLRDRFHEKPMHIASRENFITLTAYLKAHGVTDWLNDPKTSEIAYRDS